jgi:Flp pilus assembly pilin Flp
MKEILSGMIGGLITVALVTVIVSSKSKTTELVKESFKGFSGALGTAMGGDTKMG